MFKAAYTLSPARADGALVGTAGWPPSQQMNPAVGVVPLSAVSAADYLWKTIGG